VDDAAGNAFVLRRPPNVAHVLATAHDVLREHRLIAALGPTPVPVPPALAACDDPEVNGAPFFVMRFVDGVVLDSVEKAEKVPEATRRALSEDLFDTLAELHSVDLDAVGLADLARHEGYLARQVKRWSAQWEGSKTQDLPVIERVADRLRDEMPEQRATAIGCARWAIRWRIWGISPCTGTTRRRRCRSATTRRRSAASRRTASCCSATRRARGATSAASATIARSRRGGWP
jgi:hypothetical protein